MTAIVDAGPIVGAADESDPLTQAARRALTGEVGELILPAPVAAEADYLLRQRLGTTAARLFVEDIADGRFRVETLTRAEHEVALALNDRYSDLSLGLADMSVIILAHRFRTRRLITFDERHFRVVQSLDGLPFTLLPADA